MHLRGALAQEPDLRQERSGELLDPRRRLLHREVEQADRRELRLARGRRGDEGPLEVLAQGVRAPGARHRPRPATNWCSTPIVIGSRFRERSSSPPASSGIRRNPVCSVRKRPISRSGFTPGSALRKNLSSSRSPRLTELLVCSARSGTRPEIAGLVFQRRRRPGSGKPPARRRHCASAAAAPIPSTSTLTNFSSAVASYRISPRGRFVSTVSGAWRSRSRRLGALGVAHRQDVVLGVAVQVAHVHDREQDLALAHRNRQGAADAHRHDLPRLAAEPPAPPEVRREHRLEAILLPAGDQLLPAAPERHRGGPPLLGHLAGDALRRGQQEPVEGVLAQRDGIRRGADPGERRAAEHLDRHRALELGQVELRRLREARQVRHHQDPLVLRTGARRRAPCGFSGERNSSVPRPNAW